MLRKDIIRDKVWFVIPTTLLVLAVVVGALDALLERSAGLLSLDAFLLVAWVVPVLVSTRRLREGLLPLPAWEKLCLAASGALALVVRLAGGVRVPGYNNNHGFLIVERILDGSALDRDSLHGNGLLTLHKALLVVVPRTEASIAGIQVACSVLTLFAIWGLARALTGPREAAFAALTWAVLPGPVFYAMTEVHQVPGALFATLALLLLVLAIRRDDVVLLGAALLAAIAALQFVTVLLMLPGFMALFAFATPEGRRLLRRPAAVVQVGVFIAAYVPSIVRMSRSLTSNPSAYGRMIPTPQLVLHALVPAIGGDDNGNRWLNLSFTPVTFVLLSVLGCAAGLYRARTRWHTAALLLTALLLSSVQLETHGMDGMRHQLMAQGFYAILTGYGLREIVDFVTERVPRSARLVSPASGAVLVLGSAVAWPGPMFARLTPQHERRFVARAVTELPAACTILVPDGSVIGEVPSYLSALAGRDHRWVHVSDPVRVADASKDCLLWYRPAECWDCRSFGAARRAAGCEDRRAECRTLEKVLDVEPLLTERVPAIGDCDQQYTRNELEIGFFRVRAPVEAPPEALVPAPPQASAEPAPIPERDDLCADVVVEWAKRASRRTGLDIEAMACAGGIVRLKVAGAGCDFEVRRGKAFQQTPDGAFGVSPIANLDWDTAPAPMKSALTGILAALAADPSLPTSGHSLRGRPAPPPAKPPPAKPTRRWVAATVAAVCLLALAVTATRRRRKAEPEDPPTR